MSVMVPVSEAARRLGVSRHRVHQRIARGGLRAQKVGTIWLVDARDLRPARRTRPMSARMAWALAELLEGGSPPVAPSELRRLREKADWIRSAPEEEDVPAAVSSWLAARGRRIEAQLHGGDLAELRSDPRLVLSGVSDPRAGLSSSGDVEAYVSPDDAEAISAEYYLDLRGRPVSPNVILHVAEVPTSGVPALMSAADLFDRGDPRELRAGVEMLAPHRAGTR
jgi:excisionase family DNA binding protein